MAEKDGVGFVDAAMTRTPVEAAQGRLNLLIGGIEETYRGVEPLLETFSENRFYAGGPGAGHKLKLLHNFVSIGMALLVGEAGACAAEGGVDPNVFVDVLAKGGGYGAALDRVGPFISQGDTSKMQFAVANAHKDLSYYAEMAKEMNVSRFAADGLLAGAQALMDAGMADAFLSETPLKFRQI